MSNIYSHENFIEFMGDILRGNLRGDELTPLRKMQLAFLVADGVRNPLKMSKIEIRSELEKIYESDEHYTCRLQSGIILNVFEEDVEYFLSGAGRPDWEMLCLRANQWREELVSKLASRDYKKLPWFFEDVYRFYQSLLELEKCPLPEKLSGEVMLSREELYRTIVGI